MIRRWGTEGTVEIDFQGEDVGESLGTASILNTPGNIFLGGGPNIRGLTNGRYSNGFVGCIHSVRIQGMGPLNLKHEAISAVNTGPCQR